MTDKRKDEWNPPKLSRAKLKSWAFKAFGAVLLLLLIWGGTKDGGGAQVVHFIWETATSALMVLIVVIETLAAIYLYQVVRSREWFDKRGSAKELEKVQARVRSGREKPGDSVALAIQYGSITIFAAVLGYALLTLHMASQAPAAGP